MFMRPQTDHDEREAVARAIHRKRVQSPRRWDDMPFWWKDECRHIADAAIEALDAQRAKDRANEVA